MSTNVADYTGLITPWHASRPRFVSTVSETVRPFANVQALLTALPAAFDLGTAVGVQLDAVGERVGLSRTVPVPLSGLFFSWDDPVRGWDRGQWRGPYDTSAGISRLDDEPYRRLLRAKILANSWDGTVEGAQAALNVYFQGPGTNVFIQDNGAAAQPVVTFAWDIVSRGWDQAVWNTAFFSWDGSADQGWDGGTWSSPTDADPLQKLAMSVTIVVAGKLPSILDLAVLGAGYIPIKPAGVTVDYAVTTIDEAAVFGFDVQNDNISGWDAGAWGASPEYVIQNAA